MKDFEEIMQALVESLPQVQINQSVAKAVRFYWGRTDQDLITFMRTLGEDHFPLVFSIAKPDTQLDGVRYQRDAELLFCTRNTNKDMLNTERLGDDRSFKKVLFVMWDGLERAIKISQNVSIVEDTLIKEKFPNYMVGGKPPNTERWDVFKVKFRANFNEDYNC